MLLWHWNLVEIYWLWLCARIHVLLHQVHSGHQWLGQHVSIFRYDIDRSRELSRGCSTHQLQHQQHECETQVLIYLYQIDILKMNTRNQKGNFLILLSITFQTSRNVREIVCYCGYIYCNSGYLLWGELSCSRSMS